MMNIICRKSLLSLACSLIVLGMGICLAQENLPLLDPGTEETLSHGANALPPQLEAAPVVEPFTENGAPSYHQLPGASKQPAGKKFIEVVFTVERPIEERVGNGSKVIKFTRYVREVQSVKIAVDDGLDELDLPPNGKRAAVLAVTAARHEDLLKKLKEAKSDEQKNEAAEALKTNYTEHYAIETWWREQRLAELEARLTEMREQVKQRQDAQEKYVDAAMTIAELWAEGIAIAPPKPGASPENGNPVQRAPGASPLFPSAGAIRAFSQDPAGSLIQPPPASPSAFPSTTHTVR